jgi:type I restriction-modification system DNA methylase subunit
VQGDRLMRFDVVLANPPYSIKQWDRDTFASDPWGRNRYGTPPQGRADYAFWQHILQSLAPRTGRCAILFPHGVLFRQEEADMRRKLIEADVIECVLGLGPNLFYNSPMEACIVICRTAKAKERRNKILFINAVNEITRERAQSFLTDDHIACIVKAYEAFKDNPGFTRVVGLEEIRARDGNLNIPLYVSASDSNGQVQISANGSLPDALAAWLSSVSDVRAALTSILGTDVLKETLASGGQPAQMLPAWLKRDAWRRLPFGAFAQSVNERVEPSQAGDEIYVGLEHLDPQDLHIRRWGKGSDVIGTKLRFRKGDLIFGRRRAYQRKLAVAEFDGICSAHAMVVRAKPDVVLPEFLPFLMMSDHFMNRAVEISVGSLSPTINWRTLKLEEFAIPPLDQQRHIAEILWAVDEAQQAHRSTEETIKTLFDATLDEACSGERETRRLADVVAYASDGPFGSKLKTEHYTGSGARVIRLQNIGHGRFDDTDRAYISDAYFADLRRYEVRAGDIIVAGLGDETHPVGRAALIPKSLGPAVNKADCFCLRASTSVISNAYLTYFLNSRTGRSQVQERAQGTTRMRVNVGNLKTIEVPVPSITEQDRIVSRLRQIESANEAVAERIAFGAATLTILTNSLLGQP